MRKILLAVVCLGFTRLAGSDDRPFQLCDLAKSSLCRGLASIYEMEEGSDYARTSDSGGERFLEPDGANVGNSTTHKTGTYALAHAAAANSYIYVPRTNGPVGEFTVSFWIYIDTLPSASTKRVQVLSTRDSLGNEGYPRVCIYNDTGTSKLRYEVKQGVDDTVATLTSTQALSTATWYHVTFGQYANVTSSAPYQQTLWIQVNAGTRNSANITYPDVPTFGDFIVGGWLNTSPTEYGAYKIDQLAAWTFPFSPADVAKLYNSGSGKAFPFVD
jgi:hypothetical protein